MSPTVKTSEPSGSGRRRYDTSNRRAAAEQTRERVLAAAHERFLADGYAATTVAAVARAAGVAADTVYASVGRKPALFRELVERALSGTARAVPGRERDYAVALRAAPDARAKLAVYAGAVAALQGRLAPLFLVLREAAAAEPELAALWSGIAERRARNMRELADDLLVTGELRSDLSRDEIADVIWTMNSAEYYAQLVVERGWSPERFADWLLDAWSRLLLARPPR
ncbi:AcrR family transcriptional regulator [Friedmanniella endophytica]|uniref:AcrR family transcriptional regulator n=1 Tax=Microlunatus kandeliicorticis TaxID=1759536 RepID=A0A7W3IUG2_9ACTN|nr:TetR family transcriptional regulator [Microlunatus kandeliicorticis]MBA8795473.1 AcrR family transcriptional regulator [Microlunatus kandeliicorticis]